MICPVKCVSVIVLRTPADNCYDIACRIIDACGSPLKCIHTFVIYLCLICKRIINSFLKCFLLVSIYRRIYCIPTAEQLLLACTVELVVFVTVCVIGALILKIILKAETIRFHQTFCSTPLDISINIVVMMVLLLIENYLLTKCRVITDSIQLSILIHLQQHKISTLKRTVNVLNRIISSRTVRYCRQEYHLRRCKF